MVSWACACGESDGRFIVPLVGLGEDVGVWLNPAGEALTESMGIADDVITEAQLRYTPLCSACRADAIWTEDAAPGLGVDE